MHFSLNLECGKSRLLKLALFLEQFDFTLHIPEHSEAHHFVKIEIMNLTPDQAERIKGEIVKVSGKLLPYEKLTIVPLQQKDWEENWKLHFRARRIAPHIIVQPDWEKERCSFADDAVVVLNPGMAFGTGLHETTRSVLQIMDRWFEKSGCGGKVIDVGTGSGIVAIAAAKLGAKHVEALDCDPCAVKATLENVSINGVDDMVNVNFIDIANFKTNSSFDLVIANIFANTLLDEARHIIKLLALKQKTSLILAGILKQQFTKVETAYKKLGLKLVKRLDIKEWTTGEFKRINSFL
jgi:ribosomal protein L11 methyltransferase